jgi:hypothetical protein
MSSASGRISGGGEAFFYVGTVVKRFLSSPLADTAIFQAELAPGEPELDWRWWLRSAWGTAGPYDLLAVSAVAVPSTPSPMRLEANEEALWRGPHLTGGSTGEPGGIARPRTSSRSITV